MLTSELLWCITVINFTFDILDSNLVGFMGKIFELLDLWWGLDEGSLKSRCCIIKQFFFEGALRKSTFRNLSVGNMRNSNLVSSKSSSKIVTIQVEVNVNQLAEQSSWLPTILVRIFHLQIFACKRKIKPIFCTSDFAPYIWDRRVAAN